MNSRKHPNVPVKIIKSEPLDYIENTIGNDWTLAQAETPPKQQINADIIIEGVLSHESGSLIQIVPIDTTKDTPEIKEYDSHKVRLSNKYNNSEGFLTWNGKTNSNDHISVSTKPQSKYDLDISAKRLKENITITSKSENKPSETIYESFENVALLVTLAAKYISIQRSSQSKLQSY